MTVVFEVDSAVGRWRGFVSAKGLRLLVPCATTQLPAPRARVRRERSRGSCVVAHGTANDDHPAARELREYFAGKRREFTVPLDLDGQPPFRRRVLEALTRVPFGRTVTYGELARLAGNAKAARAVGQAVGANPLPVVVPCHRVLAAGGAIGGFGLGLDAKRALLRLEGAI